MGEGFEAALTPIYPLSAPKIRQKTGFFPQKWGENWDFCPFGPKNEVENGDFPRFAPKTGVGGGERGKGFPQVLPPPTKRRKRGFVAFLALKILRKSFLLVLTPKSGGKNPNFPLFPLKNVAEKGIFLLPPPPAPKNMKFHTILPPKMRRKRRFLPLPPLESCKKRGISPQKCWGGEGTSLF